jgi:hypothetical protein
MKIHLTRSDADKITHWIEDKLGECNKACVGEEATTKISAPKLHQKSSWPW